MSKPAKITAILLNLVLIAVIELTGQFFYNSGLLHWTYVLFVLASIYLIFSRYKLYDPILSQLLNFSIIALLIFAAAHILEFTNSGMNAEINLHLAGLVALIFGAELIMKHYHRRSAAGLWLWGILAAVFLLIPVIFLWKNISLEFTGAVLWTYGAAIIVIESLLLAYLHRVAQVFSLLRNFSRHIAWASLFIVLALIIVLTGNTLLSRVGIPAYQIEYFIHFSLYAALTFIFTAFLRLSELGGTYAINEKVLTEPAAAH